MKKNQIKKALKIKLIDMKSHIKTIDQTLSNFQFENDDVYKWFRKITTDENIQDVSAYSDNIDYLINESKAIKSKLKVQVTHLQNEFDKLKAD